MTNKDHLELMVEGFEEAKNGLERVAISAIAVGFDATMHAVIKNKCDIEKSIAILKDHIKNGS